MNSNRYISRNNGHKSSNELLSSPGYDDNTSNSTLSAASPDSAYTPYNSNDSRQSFASTQSWLDKSDSPNSNKVTIKPRSSTSTASSKFNSHVSNFEAKFTDDHHADHAEPNSTAAKIIMPKIDISSRRELFEREQRQSFNAANEIKRPITLPENTANPISIKERLTHLERYGEECRDTASKTKSNRSSGNFDEARHSYTSSGSESQFVNIEPKAPKIDVQIVPLKERLMTLELSMANETPAYSNKIEQRPIKKVEPKMSVGAAAAAMTATAEPRESIRADQQQKSPNSPASHSVDVRSSLAAARPSQPQSNKRTPATKPTEATSPVVRKPEVLPRRQITPDLVKVTAMAETENDLLQSGDEIDDEADNSVSLSCASPTAIPNLVNLTIKSILVNSIDLNKTSSTLSTSTSALVMGTESSEPNAHSSNNNPNIELQSSHNLNENRATVVECESQCYSKETTEQSTDRCVVDAKAIDANEQRRLDSNEQAKQMPGNELVQAKNERIKCQIVGVLEKNKVKEPTAHGLEPMSIAPQPSTPSPKMANKSPAKSPNKSKNIFDFFKRNFLNESPAIDGMDDGQLNDSLCESEPLATTSVDTVDGCAHDSNDASN